MTRRAIRNGPLWLASAAAIMPLAASAQSHIQTSASPTSRFQPPHEVMLLTRTLRRPLPDGKEVLTRRSYEIRIVPDGDGFRIDGHLVNVTVDVPQKLSALAAIERNRPDDGMFPMHLDATGAVIPGSEVHSDEAVQRAADLVSKEIRATNRPASEKLQAQAFVEQFRTRPGRSQWPKDLFRPVPGQRHEVQAIPLPDGKTGRVTIDIDAASAGSSGILSSFQRTITTDIGDDTRITYEHWVLEPA